MFTKNDSFIVMMPTGSGKSLLFELPAMTFDGQRKKWSIVVTPFLVLVKQVIKSALEKGIEAKLWKWDVELEEGTWGLIVLTPDVAIKEKFVK